MLRSHKYLRGPHTLLVDAGPCSARGGFQPLAPPRTAARARHALVVGPHARRRPPLRPASTLTSTPTPRGKILQGRGGNTPASFGALPTNPTDSRSLTSDKHPPRSLPRAPADAAVIPAALGRFRSDARRLLFGVFFPTGPVGWSWRLWREDRSRRASEVKNENVTGLGAHCERSADLIALADLAR